MIDQRTELEVINLPPGEMYLARRPMMLQTILGSCVSATFWCARLGIGALCHGVLPVCPDPWNPRASVGDGYRYVDFSIRSLAQTFAQLGARRDEVEVKLFGGADVIPVLARRLDRQTVGSMNAEIARQIVESEGLRITSFDLKGTRGRKIFFDTGTGEVLVKKLKEHEPDPERSSLTPSFLRA